MKEYLVKDFCDGPNKLRNESGIIVPEIYILSEKELFALLNDKRWEGNFEIAVYELGECILDWS